MIRLANINDNAPLIAVDAANLVQNADQTEADVWEHFVHKEPTTVTLTWTDPVTNTETGTDVKIEEFLSYQIAGSITMGPDGTLTFTDGVFEIYRFVSVNDEFPASEDLSRVGRARESIRI